MTKSKATYLYHINYYEYDKDLCTLEMKYLFKEVWDQKVFMSSIEVNPSVSPFIKSRLEVLFLADNIEAVYDFINTYNVETEDFDLKYLKLESGDVNAKTRNSLCKDMALQIKATRNINNPSLVLGVTQYQGVWYFGKLVKNTYTWRRHNNRPYTYSNSLKVNLAKVLVNIAGEGDTNRSIIDPCCGAGTVLLEGVYAGYTMTGSDISRKTSWNALRNVRHFAYEVDVKQEAIENIKTHYDACIIDLPYGLYSKTSPQAQASIISNAGRIANRVIIVSSEDIKTMIEAQGLQVEDSCKLIKSVNRSFARYIWICS